MRLFMGVCAVATVASLLAALVAQVSAEIERTVSFVTPLAAIQFGTTGLLAPLTSIFKSGLVWIAILLLVVLTSLGAVFAGDGDQRSGRLTLPERSTSVLETSTETMAHIERTSVA